jgi:hypothetical protein
MQFTTWAMLSLFFYHMFEELIRKFMQCLHKQAAYKFPKLLQCSITASSGNGFKTSSHLKASADNITLHHGKCCVWPKG